MRLTNKGISYFAITCCVLSLLIFSFKQEPSLQSPAVACRSLVLKNLDEILAGLRSSLALLDAQPAGRNTTAELKTQYRLSRKAYKQIEYFIEYYSPFEAKFYINGPLVPKVEMEISSEPFQPQGFQVIEEALFDEKKNDTAVLTKEYVLLRTRLESLREHYSTIEIEPNKLLEAMQLQLVRVMCLTLNGYDCTINKEAVTETAYVIEGLEKTLAFYETGTANNQDLKNNYLSLKRNLEKCRKELRKNPDSDTFNRLEFITASLDPAYRSLLAFTKRTGLERSAINYAVNFNAGSFFESNSINKQYFSVYLADTFNLELQAALGKLLFYDPVLSGNNKRACASCHNAGKAFADGLDKSFAFDHSQRVSRNAPTLVNSAYQKLYFHDGRAFNLEGQADGVFNNTFEMHSSAIEIVYRIRKSREYRQLFRTAFKNSPDSAVTFYAVLKSISEFVKTLDSRNSRFDKYLRGDRRQLGADEINGYNLFAGKALCGSCHFFPLFNGTVPPMFNDNEFEVIGVPESVDNKNVDPDPGREKITGAAVHRHAFKTPTVRNSELTAPYMHNGVYASLDSVLTFYNRGGGAGAGLKIPNQTLPFDSLGLNKKELSDLKKFLLCLTDTSGLPKPPTRLPVINDEDLNERKIGGEY